MLRFVLGRSGCGKSEYLKNNFAQKAQQGEDKLLYIVPDQISFETEAALLDILGPARAHRITVLGLSRLCDYVFERTGNRFLTFADEGIRHLVMSMAIEEIGDELVVFLKRKSSTDLADIMLAAVKEYKKCAISSEDLRKTAEEIDDDTLKGKLLDTALIYDAYNAIMSQSYMDPLDNLSKAAGLLEDHSVFTGYEIAVDAFYGFTSQEYEVIERLMARSKEMYVALTDDGAQGDTALFTMPRRTRGRLSRMAKSMGVDIAPYITLNEPVRFRNPETAAIEENLYRIDKNPYDGTAENISVYAAADIYDECDHVARNIRKLIEDGYRYRDIAVITRNSDPYVGILDTAFHKYDISYFMDKPQDIDAMPIVRLIGAVFDIINRGFERDDILTLLKTGLLSYTVEDIAEFENYLYIWEISGRAFFKEFTANPSGFSDTFSEEDHKRLRRIEKMRADIIGKLRAFSYGVRDADGRKISKELMRLLYALECDRNIDRLCDRLEYRGEEDLSKDLVRMWNVMCQILDKTVAVIGDYAVAPRRFGELLYLNFANTEISSIPRGLDEVDVATADRALISDKKVVFVIGAADGEFPHTPVEAGVFTDNERVALKNRNLPLSDTIEELFSTERYYVYTAMTSASERVYLSYYVADLKGEAVTPSDILTETMTAVPNLKYTAYDIVPIEDRLLSKRAAFDYLVQRYHSGSPDISTLKGIFRQDEEYAPILASIDAAAERTERKIRDPELSRALFGDKMMLSSTKIDVYHKCPFMYFCEYGLRARERRKAKIDPLEYGTLIHYIFESFFKKHDREQYGKLDEAYIAEEVSEILDGYIDSHFGGTQDKSPRFLYLFYRIKSTATKLVTHLTEELSQSDFTPVDFELGVGEDIPEYTLPLSNGLTLAVRGSVDRVDRYEKNGISYIRVVDYKTGVKEFSLSDILYGINLQMFLYMSAIEKGAKKRYGEHITPAGVLYMPAVSPSVNAATGDSDESIAQKIMKEYTMRGIILEDVDVITSMEHDSKGRYIPVRVKDNTVTAGAEYLASIEEMGAIFRRVDLLISQMAEALYDGKVDALPLKGNHDGCKYCKYRSVCLRKDDDERCRTSVRIKNDEVMDELMREEDDDEADVD